MLSLIAWNSARRYPHGIGRSASQTVAAIGQGASWNAVVPKRCGTSTQKGRSVSPARNSGSLLMSSTTTSGASRAMARRTAPRAASANECLPATRVTSMPSTVSNGLAPGHPEQISRTRCPRSAIRRKISNRWISAPPARGLRRSSQLTTRRFTGGRVSGQSCRAPH